MVEMLTVAECAKRIGWTEDRLRGLLRRGRGPQFTKVSARRIYIRSDHFEAWAETLRARKRSSLLKPPHRTAEAR